MVHRDIMWREACAFQVNNLSDLTDDQYMECLQEVHKYWQQHRTQRIERKVVAGSGPQSCADRGEQSEAYIGGELSIFKFFDNRISKRNYEASTLHQHQVHVPKKISCLLCSTPITG